MPETATICMVQGRHNIWRAGPRIAILGLSHRRDDHAIAARRGLFRAREKGKPGESRGRKASRLPRTTVRHAGRAAERILDGGFFFSI